MNKRKEKRNIPPEVRKYIRQVAEFLPKENTGIPTQRVIKGSANKILGFNKEGVHQKKYYIVETQRPIYHCVNHEKKLIDIYLKEGWKGLKEYCDKALAKVNVKPKYNDDTIKD